MIKIYRAIFGLALIFALGMALLPRPPQLPGDPSDKAQHIVAFATLAGLGAVAYPSMSLLLLLVGLSALGAVIELLQAIPALNRHSDPMDWLADTVAAAIVLAAVHWWRARLQHGSR